MKFIEGFGAAMDTKLEELVSRLKEAAGKNLESVVLYGSAASGTYKPGTSDLNVLCTLVTIDVHELQLLAPVVSWWTQEEKEPTPLFFLSEELQSSTDVFPIESLDAKRAHRVLYGSDPVAGLEIPMNLHRVQVERDLRLLLLRLRQHVLHAGKNELEYTTILKRTASGVLTLLRHTLLAFGEEPPAEPSAIFERIGAVTGAEAGAFQAAYDFHEGQGLADDSFVVYDHYIHALEKVVIAMDRLIPKTEWKRVPQ
ncbi:MAG TPA: nucleotidyltransferase domain-containing protein [Verrucomicrobiae bacterium]|nr:nucleotidyltransferase domain-containing protein [Verrucomicrobiae bacterium]